MIEFTLLDFSRTELIIHGSIFFLNIFMLFFSKWVIDHIDPGKDHKVSHRFFITINVVFLILHSIDIVMMSLDLSYHHIFIKLAFSALCVYLSTLFFNIGEVYLRRRFGKSKVIEDETVYFDSYSSRVVGLLFLVFVFILTLYSLIKIWEMDSLLETTGIFGIAIGFMALTSSVWAPDILSGLIILNANILEDGDVVIVDGYKHEYIIHKVSFIYTILYDIHSNHRTFIRNKRFIETKIDNLSRLASSDGIRKCIRYNIGYPSISSQDKDTRHENFKKFAKKIDQLFSTANEMAIEKKELPIKSSKSFEWSLTNTGDYALEYTLAIYLEATPNTKVTSLVRKHVLTSTATINSLVLEASVIVGLELKTPDLLSLSHEPHQQPPSSTETPLHA